MSALPPALEEIAALLEHLPEGDRRESLIAYAAEVGHHAPQPGDVFRIEDVRQDAECTDFVGIHLGDAPEGGLLLRISLGENVQTLTRGLAVILCRGLRGASPATVRALPPAFIARLVGGYLVRQRSRTIYYLFHRLQQAVATDPQR